MPVLMCVYDYSSEIPFLLIGQKELFNELVGKHLSHFSTADDSGALYELTEQEKEIVAL